LSHGFLRSLLSVLGESIQNRHYHNQRKRGTANASPVSV